jgi:hypothetical protein
MSKQRKKPNLSLEDNPIYNEINVNASQSIELYLFID